MPLSDMFNRLIDLLSPQDAEAFVKASTPEAEALIKAVREGSTKDVPIEKYTLIPGKKGQQSKIQWDKGVKDVQEQALIGGTSSPAARNIYRYILEYAHNKPETVEVGTSPPPGRYMGKFDRETNQIDIVDFPFTRGGRLLVKGMEESPEFQQYQETLSHELLHFLMKGMAGGDTQHKLIEAILGTPKSASTLEELMNAKPLDKEVLAKLNPGEKEIVDSIFPALISAANPGEFAQPYPEQSNFLQSIMQFFMGKP